MDQDRIDVKNIEFWNELCGSGLTRSLGITEASPENLRRFDDAYFAFYPYLTDYVLRYNLSGKKVLEIGLGYGTLGQLIASRGADYYGLDIAEGPVNMMRYRLEQLGRSIEDKMRVGSALDIPHADASFDYVYTIGCLHHTGDLPKAVSEVYRVLVPGGKAIVMLYNRNSFRRLIQAPLLRLFFWATQRKTNFDKYVRSLYDSNAAGEAAPHTDYVSRNQVKRLFQAFSQVKIDVQNFDNYSLFRGHIFLLRQKFLNNVARVIGLDLYITAEK
ncbi:MAG: class I SAM-dependent methyltransferase [Chloroflexi bacterium]|nr:class I SAM-dependent methyltransferase [Chloroflexota bacterium]